MIAIRQISGSGLLLKAYSIREEVFVKEQNVPLEEEIDEFENESRHFLAYDGAKACGTARWRFTKEGIKLERFAVLKTYRGRGVGYALVNAVLKDINQNPENQNQKIYLHAQLAAVPLYGKFGFISKGPEFEECGIQHIEMVLMG